MKFDMCGAAAVIGAMQAIARLDLPVRTIGIAAATENMPGGRALKPGDVIRSMLGKTIEIRNTDAEGRLVLGDAVAYSARYKPAALVDLATLTGACVTALGHEASGLMANDDALAERVSRSGSARVRSRGACRSSRRIASRSRATWQTSRTPADLRARSPAASS